jgi:tetratricopeptide (TPR) repeat protein
MLEGDRDGAISDLLQGQQMANEADDLLYLYLNKNLRAWMLKNIDHKESLAIFEELYDLSCTFEVPFFIMETLNDASLAYEAGGEFDLAISSLTELIKMSPLGYEDPIPTIMSRIYATMGEGKEALVWAERAFECGEELNIPQFYIRKAHALIVLNRIEEAEQNLSMAHSLILKSGHEFMLGIFYSVSGYLELGKDNPPAALDYLTEAYDIFTRNPRRQWQNLTLLGLARAELELHSTESLVTGKWLSALENHVIKHELPGIAMLTALLKAEFLERTSEFKDAREILQQSLQLSDSPGVKTLRKKISDQIKELNRLIREKELVS